MTRPTVHQECARISPVSSPPPPPAARLPGRTTMQMLMAVGEGAQGSKLMGLPCQNKSHKTSNLQCQGSAGSLSPPPKSQRNVTLHSPRPRALRKSLRPVPYRSVGRARASEGRPHPRPNKGGADSHIHQFGRLVHPHGEAILTLCGHQQLLHRGGHRLHPKRSRERRRLAGDSRPTSGGGW